MTRAVAGRFLRPSTALALAAAMSVALTVVLVGQPASGAFAGSTESTGNSVGAAPSFCTTGSGTLTDDTFVDENMPGSVSGGQIHVHVKSETGRNRRGLVRFTVPAVPGGCTLTAATLRLYASAPVTGRTIDVYRVDPAAAWSETTTTWNNQPAVVAGPVGGSSLTAPGWQEWTVTGLTQVSSGSATANSFLIRDHDENAASNTTNRYDAKDLGGANANTATRPQLLLTWG